MKIALIACVKEKQQSPCKAIEMYTGERFLVCVQKAKNWNADKIFILSGKYGLLTSETIIEPYDLNLDTQSEAFQLSWGEKVIESLKKQTNIKADEYLICCNVIYLKPFLQLDLKYNHSSI